MLVLNVPQHIPRSKQINFETSKNSIFRPYWAIFGKRKKIERKIKTKYMGTIFRPVLTNLGQIMSKESS